jgi:two-component system, OmpR family, sensor histidine kinase BaeS
MRRSLLVRLVGVSVGVALGTAATTAWLTTRGATERIRGEFQQTLEADQFIYESLRQYAIDHTDWHNVGATVRDLAERTGRRIALTTVEGEELADSLVQRGGSSARLPARPAAIIDVLARSAQPSGSESAPINVLANQPAALGLTPQETAARRVLAERAAQCIRARGQRADVEIDVRGAPTVVLSDRREPVNEADPCVPDGLFAPTAAQLAADQRRSDLTAACLGQIGVGRGVPARTGTPPPADEAEPATAPVPEPAVPEPRRASSQYEACVESARRQALTPFVAGPVRLYLGTNRGRFDSLTGDAGRTVITVAGVLALATAITILAGRRLVRPIRGLTAAAQRMEAGDRNARVSVTGADELTRLAHAFNAMAEAVERNEAHRRALISDLAHELRNPLVNIRGDLEAAEDGVIPLDSAVVRSLLEETTLLERLIADLGDLALAEAGFLQLQVVDCDLGDIAAQVASAQRTASDAAGVTLVVGAPGPVPIRADPGRIRQAIGNLVSNALRYTPAGGSVTIAAAADEREATLTVSDTGTGIAAEHIPYLFDRFYRADPSRTRATGGTGLGLAIAKSLVEGHGGAITVESDLGRGTTFRVWLPLAADAASEGPRRG